MQKLIVLLLVIGGIFVFFKYILPTYGVSGVLHAVKGVQTTVQNQNYSQLFSNNPSSSASALNTDALQNIQSQVSHLKVSDIASSSPEIQSIIRQLQKLPNDKIKASCMQLCAAL